MANTSANYRIKLAAVLDTNTVNDQIKRLNKNNTLKELKIKVTISDASLKKIKELNDLLNKTEALNKYTSGLKNIQETMKSYEKIASKVVTASKNAVTATDNIGKAAKSAEPKVKSFGDKASDAFKKFSLWSAVSSIFYQVINAVKGLVDTAIELDSAFTELQKVTDLTMDDFDKITEKAYNLGSEVAKTTTEAINAMTEFAKAGYSVEESTDILAKNALMWTNIADGTVSTAESANMIISVMKAFDIEAGNTIHIIDALNEVSNNFAVSSGDLSDSLTRSSAVLANAGVTFEEQLGLITAGTEILRNANVVSNGLKTISLRLQGMEEDGEAVDGLSAKLESDFNNLGLTLYDTNGALKSTYEILADLASIYPSLTEAEKAYYTELIAGKHRAQVAAAILNNFSTAINATETAYNSAGSAAAENAKVMESLNGHIKMLKKEWESLVNSKSTQDFLKLLVDLGIQLVKLVKQFGGLQTVLLTFIGITKGKDIFSFIKDLSKDLIIFSHNVAYAGGGLKGFAKAFATATNASTRFMGTVGIIIAMVGAIVASVDAFTTSAAELEEQIDSLNSEIEENKTKIEQIEGKLEDNKKLIEEINANPLDITDEATVKTLKEENAELKIQKALIEKINRDKNKEKAEAAYNLLTSSYAYGLGVGNAYDPNMAGVYSTNNVTTSLLGKSFKTDGLGRHKYYHKGEEISLSEYNSYLDDPIKSTTLLIEANEDLNKKIQSLNKSSETYETDLELLNRKLEYNNGLLDTRIGRFIENKDALDTTIPAHKELYDAISEIEKAYLGLDVLADDFNTFDEIWGSDRITEETRTKLIELAKSGKLTVETFEKEFPTLYAYFEKLATETGQTVDDIIAHIARLGDKTEEVVVKVTRFGLTSEQTLGQAEQLEAMYTAVSSALDEYSESGSLSVQTVSSLITNYSDYLDMLIDENGQLNLNKESIDKLVEAKKEDIKASIIQEGLDRIDALKSETAEQEKLAEATEQATEEIKKENKERYEGLLLDKVNQGEDVVEVLNEIQAQLALVDKMFISSNKTSNKSTKSTVDIWKNEFTIAYNDLNNRRDRDIIDTVTYYKELDKLNNKYFKDRVEYEEEFYKYKLELYKGDQEMFQEEIDKFDHQIAMMEYNEVDTETLIAKHREAQARIHEEAERYRKLAKEEGLKGVEDIINKYEELWWEYETSIDKYRQKDEEKIQEKFEAIQKVAIEAIDAEIEALENDLEKQNALLDEAIARYEEENDALEDQEEIQEKLLAIEEARKKLAEAKNNKVRVYREGKGFVYETDFDAVAEAQSELDSLLEEWDLFQEKSKIADIIAQLEAEKEANEKRVEEEIKDLNRLKDEWDKSLDISEDVEEYKAYLEELGESEQSNFNKRLKAIKDFTEAYKAEMATLSSTPTTENSSTTSSPLGYASGQRGSGKNSYNVYTDYQKLLNEAIASGAPADHLAYLEQKRNNKIDGEGLDYEKTYNYQYVPNKSGSSSSSSKKSSSGSSHSPVSQPASEKSSGSSLKSAVTSVIKSVGNALKSITGLASGTESADGLAHFVGEGGPELYVPPKGSGIIPNPATTNLMAWGAINPMNLVRSVMGNGNNTNIKIDNITLPNVKDADSFIEELKNFKSFAIQKQSVRR